MTAYFVLDDRFDRYEHLRDGIFSRTVEDRRNECKVCRLSSIEELQQELRELKEHRKDVAVLVEAGHPDADLVAELANKSGIPFVVYLQADYEKCVPLETFLKDRKDSNKGIRLLLCPEGDKGDVFREVREEYSENTTYLTDGFPAISGHNGRKCVGDLGISLC